MVLLVTLVMCIMGGRVFPMFTANGTQTPRTPALPWLEKLSIVSTIFAVVLSFQILPVAQGIILLPCLLSVVWQTRLGGKVENMGSIQDTPRVDFTFKLLGNFSSLFYLAFRSFRHWLRNHKRFMR